MTNLAITVANTSYSLLEYLHGMQGGQRFESAWLHKNFIVKISFADDYKRSDINNFSQIWLIILREFQRLKILQ